MLARFRFAARAACVLPALALGPILALLFAPGCGGSRVPQSPDGGGAGGSASASSSSGGGDLPFIDGGGGGPAEGCSDAGGDELPPLTLTGCEGLDAGGVTFSHDVVPIFAMRCSGELCHVTPSYESTVGKLSYECCDRPLVAPGDPAHSYLVQKIQAIHLCAGGPMPLGQDPLPDLQIQTVVKWICAGAPND